MDLAAYRRSLEDVLGHEHVGRALYGVRHRMERFAEKYPERFRTMEAHRVFTQSLADDFLELYGMSLEKGGVLKAALNT